MELVNLKALDGHALEVFVSKLGEPAYRARQLMEWMYERRVVSIEEITVFSKGLRKRLAVCSYIGVLELKHRSAGDDGTEKFLFGLDDGLDVECVLIPDGDRQTLCISSQIGCAMGCVFCKTGTMGFVRNLDAFEIVEQLLATTAFIEPRHITNIVFMGMGEPLKNLDAVSSAIGQMTGFLSMSPRRITVSTCGVVPGIKNLPKRSPDVNLAVSLNATTDDVRDSLMPINRRYPIADLMAACRSFPLRKNRTITFEYVLLEGVNDSAADAKKLVALLKGVRAKVNLIPFNMFEGAKYKPSPHHVVLAFQERLTSAGVHAFIRKSKGGDVMAACGQLWSKEASGSK